MAADSKAHLSHGERNGEEDNADPSVDEGRGTHAEVAHAREDEDGNCAKAGAERRCDVWSGVKTGRDAGGRSKEERDVVSKREAVPEDERASETCLHCEINDLVQEHVEGQERVDLVAVAANIAESLVDLILLCLKHRSRQIDRHFNPDPVTFSSRNDRLHDIARESSLPIRKS
jgi:hypothetical protein